MPSGLAESKYETTRAKKKMRKMRKELDYLIIHVSQSVLLFSFNRKERRLRNTNRSVPLMAAPRLFTSGNGFILFLSLKMARHCQQMVHRPPCVCPCVPTLSASPEHCQRTVSPQAVLPATCVASLRALHVVVSGRRRHPPSLFPAPRLPPSSGVLAMILGSWQGRCYHCCLPDEKAWGSGR